MATQEHEGCYCFRIKMRGSWLLTGPTRYVFCDWLQMSPAGSLAAMIDGRAIASVADGWESFDCCGGPYKSMDDARADAKLPEFVREHLNRCCAVIDVPVGATQ